MSNMAWSEQELANAAKRVAESMLTSFRLPVNANMYFPMILNIAWRYYEKKASVGLLRIKYGSGLR